MTDDGDEMAGGAAMTLDDIMLELREVTRALNLKTDIANAQVQAFERFLTELSLGVPFDTDLWSYRRHAGVFRICIRVADDYEPFAEAPRWAKLAAFPTFGAFAYGLLSEAKALVEQ